MRPHHLASHHQHRELDSDSTLHVVTCISNPARYESRYRLARKFVEEMSATRNVKLYVVEAAYGDRRHEVTESPIFRPDTERHDHHPRHLQLRTHSEIWIKEAMLNLGILRLLPRDARYIAWVDADVTFRDPDWALETIHELQHFPVVQPWRHAMDLDARGNVMQTFESFGYRALNGAPKKWNPKASGGYGAYHSQFGHTGYAWACTRSFYESVGGLLDFAVLGAGDRHMAFGLIGYAAQSMDATKSWPSPGYRAAVLEWQRKAKRASTAGVGFVDGRLEHAYHGSKAARGYSSRWQILIDWKFDPYTDLMKDHQGLIQLTGKPGLEREILRYNRARDEDGG